MALQTAVLNNIQPEEEKKSYIFAVLPRSKRIKIY